MENYNSLLSEEWKDVRYSLEEMNRDLYEERLNMKWIVLDGINTWKRLHDLYGEAVTIYNNFKLRCENKKIHDFSQHMLENIRKKANKLQGKLTVTGKIIGALGKVLSGWKKERIELKDNMELFKDVNTGVKERKDLKRILDSLTKNYEDMFKQIGRRERIYSKLEDLLSNIPEYIKDLKHISQLLKGYSPKTEKTTRNLKGQLKKAFQKCLSGIQHSKISKQRIYRSKSKIRMRIAFGRYEGENEIHSKTDNIPKVWNPLDEEKGK